MLSLEQLAGNHRRQNSLEKGLAVDDFKLVSLVDVTPSVNGVRLRR